MMLAASLAGIGFGSAGVHVPHACAYPIATGAPAYQPAGYPDDHPFVPHGHSVIVTSPAAFRFTYDACPERHRRVAELLLRPRAARRRRRTRCRACWSSSCATSARRPAWPSSASAEADIPASSRARSSRSACSTVAPREVDADALTGILRGSLAYW